MNNLRILLLALSLGLTPALAWAAGWLPLAVSVVWSPPSASVPLLAWYKADVGVFTDTACSTPATNSTTVACWKDQSGNGYDIKQTTAGNRPTFLTAGLNSKQTVSFVAASVTNLISGTGVAMGTSTQASGFCVAQYTTNTSSFGRGFEYIQAATTDTATSAGLFMLRNSNVNQLEGFKGSAVGQQGVSLVTTVHWGTVFDGANGITYLNNVASSPTAITAAFVSNGFVLMGVDFGGAVIGSAAWDGPISECVLYSGALSSTDRSNLEAYFTSRW